MPKSPAILALGLGKPKGDDDMAPPEEEDRSDAETMAAEDMISAMKSGDASAMSDAMKRFGKACGWTGSSSEYEE